MSSRELFETWHFQHFGYGCTRYGDEYVKPEVSDRWVTWQGAVACTEPPTPELPKGLMFFPVAAWDFLRGKGSLEGISFGERHPSVRGPYWWRSQIQKMILEAGKGGEQP